MTHQFSVSDLGFRLIKAYEGYRPESRVLDSGTNVVGYGHRIADQDAIALTRAEAEMLLRQDIQPVEELVNEAVFAPLTQGQFDALCSLAYNIGPDAFLKSDVVKAVNNGRPIDAANGFDVWRKGEIDGEIFIIDALVRRRTAEKALFLKPDRRAATSPRDSLPPKPDDSASQFNADDIPVYTQDDAQGYVDQTPYDQGPKPKRRREDGPAGILELSEYYDDDDGAISQGASTGLQANVLGDDAVADEIKSVADEIKAVSEVDNKAVLQDQRPDLTLSPIAEAAAEVSDRLKALIDDQAKAVTDVSDMPDSLLNAEPSSRPAKVLPFKAKTTEAADVNQTANEALGQAVETAKSPSQAAQPIPSVTLDDVQEVPSDMETQDADSAARFIQRPNYVTTQPSSLWSFGIMMLSGLVLFGASLYANIKDPISLLGPWGAVAAMAGLIMGGLIILGSIYYMLKSAFSE